MTTESRAKVPVSNRLLEAANYTSDYWFPVNDAITKVIRENIHNGTYDENSKLLLSHIKSDFSLFLQCLRELARVTRDDGAIGVSQDPFEALETLEVVRLKNLVSGALTHEGRHRLSDASSLQASRIGEAMMSAGTAEVLAEHAGVSPGLCYSAALLRQLGVTLIAWNYPQIYQRCVSSLRTGAELDLMITRSLGFSPSTLAITILRRWGIGPELCASVSMDSHEGYTPEVRAVAASVASICKVGETLARANQPQVYPDAQDEWQAACTEIELRLGPDGLRTVFERVIEACESYVLTVPHLFQGGQIFAANMQPATPSERRPEERNRFLKGSSEKVRAKLQDVYILLTAQTGPSPEPLRLFVRDAVPAAGFIGGAVYTIEPSSGTLVPQLLIGNPHVPQEALSLTDDPDAPLTVAVFQNGETEVTVDGNISLVASVLGYSQRVGVLYLEMPRSEFEKAKEQNLHHFHAFVQTVNDCLFLR